MGMSIFEDVEPMEDLETPDTSDTGDDDTSANVDVDIDVDVSTTPSEIIEEACKMMREYDHLCQMYSERLTVDRVSQESFNGRTDALFIIAQESIMDSLKTRLQSISEKIKEFGQAQMRRIRRLYASFKHIFAKYKDARAHVLANAQSIDNEKFVSTKVSVLKNTDLKKVIQVAGKITALLPKLFTETTSLPLYKDFSATASVQSIFRAAAELGYIIKADSVRIDASKGIFAVKSNFVSTIGDGGYTSRDVVPICGLEDKLADMVNKSWGGNGGMMFDYHLDLRKIKQLADGMDNSKNPVSSSMVVISDRVALCSRIEVLVFGLIIEVSDHIVKIIKAADRAIPRD